MNKLAMLVAFTLALGAAATPAIATDVNPPLATPDVNPAADSAIDIGTWLAAETDKAMQETVAQTGVSQAVGCRAKTQCFDGTTISCSGTSVCYSEWACNVYCDSTGRIWCNSPCP